MSLKETASQTLEILNAGYFLTPDGQRVNIEPALSKSVAGTRLYTPEQASALPQKLNPVESPTFTGAFDRVVLRSTTSPGNKARSLRSSKDF